TVQDLGRPGQMRHGVSPGGALDRGALILGNRLCGNDPGAAGLEITLTGPRLRFTAPAVVALTGADLGATLDALPAPIWQPVAVLAGAELVFPPAAKGRGARAYLCVAGGIAVPTVLGSLSTDLAAGLGGVNGRALRSGDRLTLGRSSAATATLTGRRLVAPPPPYDDEVTIRVILGPQRDRFTKKGVAAFLSGPYTVSPKGDRMGVRLTGGPPIAHRRGSDLISEGIVPGSIQVPGDGQPIALLAACQTMGGYPKIATVIDADLDLLCQIRPGGQIRFAAVEPAAARTARLTYRASLGDHAITRNGRQADVPVSASTNQPPHAATPSESRMAGALDAWTPDGVIRVISAARDAGLTSFRLDLDEGDRHLTLQIGGSTDEVESIPNSGPSPVQAQLHASPATSSDSVSAPMLGVFYRQAAPGDAPFATPGQPVHAGQTIGLLEVMKTYHEVTAHRDGILAEFLIADGDFVEYGQAIARIT
ncbi:MAG: 5-oxoprolinase/urea amidolyase family protein, partial [Chloroflexia bacterium]|nr:5-oxoprolinase/urea amidolyase family protein [Chloroflexia bacterium]